VSAPSSAPVLAVRDVRKSFGAVRAVDGVSFEVRPGTITGLLGRNGAGKTTTLRMINRIFLPDSGEVLLFDSRDAEAARDRVGYLPEERGLYKKMKILEQLLFFAEIKHRKSAEEKRRAGQWLARFGLADAAGRRLEELSKGNQQKVQIIAALIHDPELVIMDEPMSGLDPVNVVLVREVLKELRAAGRTILLSTHMMGEAERMVDDIVLIHRGRAVLSGSLSRVKSSHGTDTVHLGFEGDGTFLAGLPGVSRASVQHRAAELRLSPGADPQALLSACAARLRLHRFEVAAPSLEEIFIDTVGDAPAPAAEAAS
jgi:ABC-2 type transport system ATP-binding protein